MALGVLAEALEIAHHVERVKIAVLPGGYDAEIIEHRLQLLCIPDHARHGIGLTGGQLELLGELRIRSRRCPEVGISGKIRCEHGANLLQKRPARNRAGLTGGEVGGLHRENDGAIHLSLIDPEKLTPESASRIARESESGQSAAIMIGGSTLASTTHLDDTIRAVKSAVDIPVILFPNNITGISKYADALWFMSLLNSLDPYFITGAQALGAPLVKKFSLEAIPLGYIVVGQGATVGIIGRASPIPYNKPELAAAHALAAKYLGMRFVYLEAGSGAKKPVPNEMIKMVKDVIGPPLIVGGGIKAGEQAREKVMAGADIIVTGNILEEEGVKGKVKELVKHMNWHPRVQKRTSPE